MMLASLIDTSALLKIILAGFAGGAGVVIAFALVLLGRSRLANTDGGDGAKARVGYGLLVLLGSAFCVAALVVGFIAMTKK